MYEEKHYTAIEKNIIRPPSLRMEKSLPVFSVIIYYIIFYIEKYKYKYKCKTKNTKKEFL